MRWCYESSDTHLAIGLVVDAFYPALKAAERGERVDLQVLSCLACDGDPIEGRFSVRIGPPGSIPPDPENPAILVGNLKPIEVCLAIGLLVDSFYRVMLDVQKKGRVNIEIRGSSPLYVSLSEWEFDIEIEPPYH